MSNFKKIFPFVLPYKKYAYLNIFFNVLYAIFGTLSFVSLTPMMDVLFGKAEQNYIEPTFTWDLKKYLSDFSSYHLTSMTDNYGIDYTLGFLVAVIITIFLLKNLSDYLALFFITFLRNGILKDIRNAMYKKTLDLPLAFFSEKRKGDTISRIAGDVNEVQSSFLSILELVVKEPLTIVFSIIVMFTISVKLTIFVFIFIPISGTIISLIGKKLKKQSTKAQEEQGIFLSIIEETLGGLKVVKGYNSEKYFGKIFQNSTDKFFGLSNTI